MQMFQEKVKYGEKYDQALDSVKRAKKKLKELGYIEPSAYVCVRVEHKGLKKKRIGNVGILLLMMSCAFCAFYFWRLPYSALIGLMSEKNALIISGIIGVVWVSLAILLTCFNARGRRRAWKDAEDEWLHLFHQKEEAEKSLSTAIGILGSVCEKAAREGDINPAFLEEAASLGCEEASEILRPSRSYSSYLSYDSGLSEKFKSDFLEAHNGQFSGTLLEDIWRSGLTPSQQRELTDYAKIYGE